MKERLKKFKLTELRDLARGIPSISVGSLKKEELLERLLEVEEIETLVKQFLQEAEKTEEDVKEVSQEDSSLNDDPTGSSQRKGAYDKEEYEKIINNKNSATAEGILEVLPDGFGFLRGPNYISTENDVYISPSQIRRFNMKTGDKILGILRPPGVNDKFSAILYVKSINGLKPEVAAVRKDFDKLIPIYPNERLKLDNSKVDKSVRFVDVFAPIGKGQRGLIVAPPKAGKTTLLKSVANAILANHPDIELIILLVDERPEEVTDIRESVNADVISSTFDELPTNHIKVSEMVLARAKNLVEHGRDVVILMDSITRMARAYNLTINPTGRTLSGGLDPGALYGPKKFFGAARNVREGGSLTILATALIDTGSRMDDVIYEEFKGTGNMELHLDRKLAEKRFFPAIDIYRSGTRKEELLLDKERYDILIRLRRALSNYPLHEVMGDLIMMINNATDINDFIQGVEKMFPEMNGKK